MNWPWVSRKRFDSYTEEFTKLHARWATQEIEYQDKVNMARIESANSVRKELREWMVDLNYEIFHSADSVAKNRMYAALTDGARQFKVSL